MGAFGALLTVAIQDPATAHGFALAYASLEARHRMQIIDAVICDADAEGIGASAVLASLLTVEEDIAVARYIADAMTLAGDMGLHSLVRSRALLAGTETDGGVMLIRPLHGAFVEVLALAWNEEAGITHNSFEPMAHHATAKASARALPSALRFEEMPVAFAIDIVTYVLWNHRRLHHALPECVEHFADMFSIQPSSGY
ncbi:MAG: hypothetical protein RL701_3100 [Pseudomonadota bacterium]|jgi:hypothetical protein